MKSGIAFASKEFAHGICSFAAPIVVGTRLRGALNVERPIARFTADIETSINLHRPLLRRGHRAFRNPEPINAAISGSL
jgi:DNA-binding IclR family transcriptional regulator